MEQEQEQNLRQHVWNYLSLYGAERARLLRLFVAVGSALILGAAGLLRTEATEIVVAPLGGVLMILGILFWLINWGLTEKVRRGEAAFRHLDAGLKLPNEKGGAPHVLCLLEPGAVEKSPLGGCDESAIGSTIYLIFAILGFFFVVAPYYPKEMAVVPVAMETPPPLVKPLRRAGALPQATPPGFNPHRLPGTPIGYPNRVNPMQGRPGFGAPQPGFPGGVPPTRVSPPTGAAPAGAVPPGGAPNGALQPGVAPGAIQPARPALPPAVQPAPVAVPAAPAVPVAPVAPAPGAPER